MNPETNTTELKFDPKLFASQVLRGLGSLKITVFLLVLGLFLVLIATLQQSRKDIYKVKQQHFQAPVVFIEFQELLTPAWFPNMQQVGGGFLMPSGAAVLIAMLLNLLCAHVVRFRIQAKGTRLLFGSAFLVFGVITTLLVISNGSARGEFQEEPLIDWQTQWTLLQYLLGAAGLAGLAGGILLESTVRRMFSFVTGLVLVGALAFLLYKGSSAFIGDDAMRVVWRLTQGSVAAIVCYIGALLVFKRKAGIVVIHAGLLMLMVGELYTTYSAQEQRLFFFEGDTTSHTIDVNQVELAIISDTDDDSRQDVVAVPVKRLAIDGPLSIDGVPFDIETVAYYPNSQVRSIERVGENVPGAKGLAEFVAAEEIAETTGTGMGASEVNEAAAYVKLTEKGSGKQLGTYLLSQRLYQNDSLDLDRITVDGKEWQIALRFKHIYKPYSVRLNTTTRTNYTGTDTPKSYSSSFRIIDPDNNVDDEKYISMNNPLRYNNETFYQSGHDTDPGTGRKYSVLQVVKNTGWMIPYVSCAMVGIGLLLHFLGIFLRFVERMPRTGSLKSGAIAAARTVNDPIRSAADFTVREYRTYDKTSICFVIGFVLLFSMFAYRKVPKPVVYEEMNLEQFGQIPIAYGGRVQPLDSLARSNLRQFRKYEIPVKWDRDASEEVKYSPIRWLADWIYAADGSDEYRIFKIDDPDTVQALQLIRRKSHLYSIKELREVEAALDKYVSLASVVKKEDESKLTNFHKKVLKLSRHIQQLEMLRYSLGSPASFQLEDPVDTLSILLQARVNANIPLAIPGEEENDWSVFSPVMGPEWIKSLSEQYGSNSVEEVAQKMLEDGSIEKMRQLVVTDEMRRAISELQGSNVEDADDIIEAMLSTEDPQERELTNALVRSLKPRIDAAMQLQVDSMRVQLVSELSKIVHVSDGQFDFSKNIVDAPMTKLRDAYLAKDATAFNGSVQLHRTQIENAPDVANNLDKVNWEHRLNRISPFYLATAIYIGAFLLSLLSWLFLTGAHVSPRMSRYAAAARRAAFWLVITGFALHTAGLLMRIYVSGRPPVTNLYGSAVFIGWVGVLMGLVTERMIGFCFGSIKSSCVGVTTLLVAFALGAEGDTFSVLQAVLDTQFWLSTHVVTITIGYAGTLVAGMLGILYLATSMFIPKDLTESRKTLAKMVYGVTCLSLIFSFVGTVLGGLWADDSWGRFWGWDPKENGALMIVLVNAILLHGRWAGLIKDRGMAMVAIFGNIVTLWSWFAVNELGIGLHTYGLTEGRMKVVGLTWLAHLGLIVFAFIPTKYWLGNRAAARNRSQS